MTQEEIILCADASGISIFAMGMDRKEFLRRLDAFAKLVAAKEREACQWGVDWGKAGDIPCVSIIKRLPDGGIKVLAVEYAPYSYTTSPKPEQDDGMCTACENNLCTAKQGCVALDNPPQRTWVGLTAGEILDALISVDEKTVRLPSMLGQFACAIEAKLKEKNSA